MIYDGWNVLYIVCKYNNILLCKFLLFERNYRMFFFNKKLNVGWYVGYYVVVGGSIEILNFFEKNG